MKNPRLRAAVEYCQGNKHQKAVFVVPFSLAAEDALALRDHPCCASMILRNPDPKVTAQSSHIWLGCFADDGISWQLPKTLGPFVFIGPPAMLTKNMVDQIAATGSRSVVCEKKPHHLVEVPLFRFHMWQLGEKAIQKISNLPSGSPAYYLVKVSKKIPGARMLWHSLFRRGLLGAQITLGSAAQDPAPTSHLDAKFFRVLLKRALEAGGANKNKAVSGRIVLVNAGLAAGGAERQIVNTLIGLKSKGINDICLIGEYIHRSPGLDFYLPHLESAGIEVQPVTQAIKLAEQGYAFVPGPLGDMLAKMPGAMAEEILNLADEFRERRPAVVHAWQDSTSIKAGIAAVIAGVPRIVLGSRNVIPVNFGYYQEYMRSAYQALTEIDRIVFLNNSDAGATDYCRWLEIPRERFRVIRNGVNFSGLKRTDDSATSMYRQSLGIPQEAPVIGSIFRFWAEKRPMLWLEAARRIVKQISNAHFLLIGEGPMRSEMEDFVRKAGFEKKVHMPGARTDIATPLSAMTAFMLTSEFEGTPNVVLEAQWLGLPVVATDAGGTREAIEEGMTGWCCSKPDATEIAAKVIQALSNKERLLEMRQLGPCFIERQFCINKMVDNTLRLYN